MNETREQIIGEITALKSLLRDTDYEVTKYAEGLTDCATQEEIEAYREAFLARYGEVIDNRKAWRAKINELEEALDALAQEDENNAEAETEDDGYTVYPDIVGGDITAEDDNDNDNDNENDEDE